MNPSNYIRFKQTVETAQGQQLPSPFSRLLTGAIEIQQINDRLNEWQHISTIADKLLTTIHHWLITEVDPEIIENQQQIPDAYLQGLRRLDCLRARIPEQYGGLGLSQCHYSRLLEKIASRSEVLALVVSVQQLGVAQGLLSAQKLEQIKGYAEPKAEALRQKYLNKLAYDSIGAFSLTTPETGSDPSRLQTTAIASEDGSYYILNGDSKAGGKLFTTLGTIADVFIMLAVVIYPGEQITDVDPRHRITAFLVDRDTPGISVIPLSFCGWRGLPNAAIKLDRVKLPTDNRLGAVGDGLKIAFMNLGSGRINIAAISLGMMKQLQRTARWWGAKRIQGGKHIGAHELNTELLANMNANIYACESFLQFVSALADQPNSEIRLEAAMLKLFTSHCLVDCADETLQLRGGRGYETYASQTLRGETPVAVERLFRSARMMKIGEGGSNILKLYIMRCLLDEPLQQLKSLSANTSPPIPRLLNLLRLTVPSIARTIFSARPYRKLLPKVLAPHIQTVTVQQRYLYRLLVHNLIAEYGRYFCAAIANRFKPKPAPLIKPQEHFEQRQVLLGHCAWIAVLLSAITISCLRAARSNKPTEITLADEFSKRAHHQIRLLFEQAKNRDDKSERQLNKFGDEIMQGCFSEAVEQNIVPLDLPDFKD